MPGLENADHLVAIDTLSNKVVATIPIGQAPQALVYVSNAVPNGGGTENLQPLGVAGQAAHLTPGVQVGRKGRDQRFAVRTGAGADSAGGRDRPGAEIALSCWRWRHAPTARGRWNRFPAFTTNPAGAAIVNATGPIRQIVQGDPKIARRYLVIAEGTPEKMGAVVQIQQ